MSDDYKLINEITNGNTDSFEKLLKKYVPTVYNTAYSIIGNNNDIDDIVQEVFIKVYNSIADFKQKSSFKTWLYRITVNKCYDMLRKNKIRKTVPIEETLLLKNSDKADSSDKAQELLNMLLPKDRAIITLKELEGFTYKEISKTLKCSVASVKVRLFRARRELIRRYKEHE